MSKVEIAAKNEVFGHFIGGEWIEQPTATQFPGIDPTTERQWYSIPEADPETVDRAVLSAHAALKDDKWRRLTHTERGALMRRLAELVSSNVGALAAIETRDNGKLLRETTGQVRRVPSFLLYYAGLADKIEGSVIPGNKPDLLNYTLREPVGVVAAIVPWNSPLQLAMMKIAPALAAGNTLVIKPSEHASASLLALMPLFEEAGFPPGVVNLVTGASRTGAALVEHPLVAKVAFTGGTEAGRRVAMSASSHFASATLELGGKSPQLVFADADPARATAGILSGIFAASGQTCVAGSRVYVQSTLYDEIVERVARRTATIRIGDPSKAETEMGPLAVESQRDRVEHYVDLALAEGAHLEAGGRRPVDRPRGWFYEPTVFSGLENGMAIAQEEIFGPVLGIGRFDTEEQAIELANDSKFALAAGVWTNNLQRAHRLASSLEAGTVWINTYRSLTPLSPFGGFKDSGMGKENGIDAMREYTRVKSVWVDLSEAAIDDPFVGR